MVSSIDAVDAHADQTSSGVGGSRNHTTSLALNGGGCNDYECEICIARVN